MDSGAEVRGVHNVRDSDMSDWEVRAAAEECAIRTRLQLLEPPEYVCGVAYTYREAGMRLIVGQSLEYADAQIEEEHQWIYEGWARGNWSWVPRPQP
eukprot:11873086-Alexandrium_andersonii.AAC.1